MPSLALILLSVLGRPLATPQLEEFQLAPLRGINDVQVLVEELSPAAGECGVTKEGMQLAASRPLLDGGIKVNPASPVTLYGNVHIGLTGEGICIVNIRTAAWVFIPNAVMPYSSKPVVVKAVLWEQERLFSRFKFDAAANIRDTVRGMVDQFVTKWKLANQK